ncbi:MAG: type I restriction endonuclease [Bacteroidales bacterium]|nr:type I restriction endonuclease [Bacteroidales bacterium]
MSKGFNEATRVQMAALYHLTRIGYSFIGKISESQAGTYYDADTNILLPIFKEQFEKLNPGNKNFSSVLTDIKKELDDDDLGRQFYRRLTSVSPVRLVDFENPANNTYHCTAEFTCKNGDDEFRPDVTLFINGLPLVFIEVKVPNNAGGMVAEANRMNNQRLPNRKFRRFLNITQLMLFSNNMEYDAKGGIVPIEGVFYGTNAKGNMKLNCFREENIGHLPVAPFNRDYPYSPVSSETEKAILVAFNNQVLRENPEYKTNCEPNTPTNRVLTSMCCPQRLLYLLKYGIAYLHISKEEDGVLIERDEKHIMRYQQLFSTFAIQNKLADGAKSGIIWHTQGSGKTALSYYLVKILSDFYAKRNTVAQFYFIVDRLDLLEQASQEFAARGLTVATANTRAELMAQFRDTSSLKGSGGSSEITVVNIQRFEEDKTKVDLPSYSTNLQRVFIMDEAHRGYKPEGSFLANLFNADKDSIKIALTGTPLIGEERSSCQVFGDYLHTYYYDQSIKDGYTLKLIREEIETRYRKKINEAFEKVEKLVEKGEVRKEDIISHKTYVSELLKYIIRDLRNFRLLQGDESLGGMVICESSDQAKMMNQIFAEIQNEINAEDVHKCNFRHALILHDSDDKETRKKFITGFKKDGTIDILIVYNMLLTGFDAPRLKRLYFGRKVKDHNLLQAITRVNRPYKDMKHGYVIDFADIKKNFDETNEAYMRELNRYNVDIAGQTGADAEGSTNLPDMYAQVMENKDELVNQIKENMQVLFDYDTDNVENFTTEISTKEDKQTLSTLRDALLQTRDAYNLVRTFGDDELKQRVEQIKIEKLPLLITEVQRRINIINQKEAFERSEETTMAINQVMLEIQFDFQKISEDELKIIDGGSELQEVYQNVLRAMMANTDPEDIEFITLKEAFEDLFRKHGFKPENLTQYKEQSDELKKILARLNEIRRANENLLKRYNGDAKFAYVHKRIREENQQREAEHKKPIISKFDQDIVSSLNRIKAAVDQRVYDQNSILKQDSFFSRTVMNLLGQCFTTEPHINMEIEDYDFVKIHIANQYINQYNKYYNA